MGHLNRSDHLPEIAVGAGFKGPLQHRHHALDTMEKLREAAQLAIQVEWTTVPAYLTALYSIKDTTSPAYQALRSVVVEEMFHMNQAANILVGIGGRPVFTNRPGCEAVVPRYPTHLPSANHDTTPYVGLYRASPAVFRTVFMGIETPAPYEAPAEGARYSTIAQLYKALEDGLEQAVKTIRPVSAVFREAPGACQRTDIYLGKFGGKAIEVTDLDSAKLAIRQVVQQGEGASTRGETLVLVQPWGEKNYYGTRVDGTYGPILGTPWELSHYFKFQAVADADSFPETYPITSNPKESGFLNPKARIKSYLFNAVYTIMLQCLELTFTEGQIGHDLYFQVVLPLMHNAMPTLARELMTTPIDAAGDSGVGPNAAPTFEYLPNMDWEIVLDALAAYVTGRPMSAEAGDELVKALADHAALSDHERGVAATVEAELRRLGEIARPLVRKG